MTKTAVKFVQVSVSSECLTEFSFWLQGAFSDGLEGSNPSDTMATEMGQYLRMGTLAGQVILDGKTE